MFHTLAELNLTLNGLERELSCIVSVGEADVAGGRLKSDDDDDVMNDVIQHDVMFDVAETNSVHRLPLTDTTNDTIIVGQSAAPCSSLTVITGH